MVVLSELAPPDAGIPEEVILFFKISQVVIIVSLASEQVLALFSLDCVIGERSGAAVDGSIARSLHLITLMLRFYLRKICNVVGV